MGLFFNRKKKMPDIDTLKNDPTTKEVEQIKHKAHHEADEANILISKLNQRIIENGFTIKIHKAMGGK